MKPSAHVISPLIKTFFLIVCNVQYAEIRKIPRKGPCILVMNHINFLEVPLVYTLLYPRNMTGLAKRETWNNPFFRFLANVLEAIPVDRHATDVGAMRACIDSLKKGKILLLAPEGTRSGDGKLRKGHAGVVQIALHSGVPIIPIAHFGGEHFWKNLKAWRRTRFRVRVGAAFRITERKNGFSRSDRMEITDEIMNRISLLLPEAYRGAYPRPEEALFPHLEILETQA